MTLREEEAAGKDDHLKNKSCLCMKTYFLFSFPFAFLKISQREDMIIIWQLLIQNTGFNTKEIKLLISTAKHWQGKGNVQHLNDICLAQDTGFYNHLKFQTWQVSQNLIKCISYVMFQIHSIISPISSFSFCIHRT